jgi:hypothetical protein
LQAAGYSTWSLMQAAVRDRFAGGKLVVTFALILAATVTVSSAHSQAPCCIPAYDTSRAQAQPYC